MIHKETVLLIVLLVACVALSAGQTCETFAGSPSYCVGRINYQVFVPPGLTQDDLAGSLQSLTATISLDLIPEPCLTSIEQLACSKAFRACDDTTFLPLALCPNMCPDYNLNCPFLQNPENCTATDPFNPTAPLYAPGEPCTFANGTEAGLPLPCPDLFVHNSTGHCVIQCPPPGFDDKHYQRIYQVMVLVLSSISIVCLLLLILTGIATWDKRRSHAYFHIGGLFLQLIGVWIGKWLPYAEWMCVNNHTVRDQSSTAGALQAAFVMLGTHSAAVWNLVLVYSLFLRITENRYQIFGPDKLIPVNPEVAYGFLGWFLIPVPLTIAMFAGNYADNSIGWIMLPNATALDGWVFIILYIIPITILAAIQIVLMCFLFFLIARHAGFRGVQSQLRLLILCIHYAFRTSVGIIYSYDQLSKRHETSKHLADYVKCHSLGVGCPYKNPGYVGGAGGILNAFLVSSAGIIILLIFLDFNVINLWKRWILCKGFTASSGTGSTSLAEDHSGALSSSRL